MIFDLKKYYKNISPIKMQNFMIFHNIFRNDARKCPAWLGPARHESRYVFFSTTSGMLEPWYLIISCMTSSCGSSVYNIIYDILYIWYHIRNNGYDMCHGICHIWCRVHMMSYVWCIMISYMISSLIQPCSNAGPGLFKCSPGPTRFGSNVGPARPESTLPSVCLSCIAIGLQWFITPYQASRRMHLNPPLPPPTPLSHSSCLGEYRSDFGARLYRSTSLRLMYTEYSASSNRLHLKFFKTPRMTSACASARPPGCGAFICSPSDVRPGGATTIRQAR